jgi:predicted Zn-dependent protease
MINDAASLWNEALGKNLFVYDSTGNTSSLKINLVYDERQKKTDDTKLLSAEIENTKQAAEKLQTEYEAMKIDFSTLQETYLNNIEIFNARQKTYNDTVISWNEKGGAPKNEYDTLTLEKESLQKESAKLEQDRATLDAMLVTINAKITKHNDLVLFANKNVAIGNSGANKKFTEGNYNSGTNSITIYQFSDAVKLQRVLAHELGHALGIDHTQNKQSIMYSVNTGTTTTLAKEDMQALNDVCSKK